MKISSINRHLRNLTDEKLETCLSKPKYISFIITKKCNLKCLHCDIWKNQDLTEINDEQWLKLLDKIKNWLGKQEIEINGGEPMLKKDLVFKIIKKCNELNLPVGLNTNGILIDIKTAKELFKHKLQNIKISLYSLNNEIHDKLRGMSGAFLKTKEALEHLNKERNLSKTKIELGMLLTKSNINEINSLINYAKKNNFDLILQPLDFNINKNYQNNWQQTSDLWPTKEQIEKYLKPLVIKKPKLIKNPVYYLKEIYEYYLEPKSINQRKCFAIYNNLVIEPNGDVRLCFRSQKIGNIGQNKIEEIWCGNSAKKERKRLRSCQKSCKILGCNIRKQIKDFL